MKKLALFALLFFFATSAFASQSEKDLLAKYKKSTEDGAAWLAKQQNPNGSFGKIPGLKEQGDVGITGIVLMALGSCPPDIQKKHQAVLEKALSYILKHQKPNGAIFNPGRGIDNYQTSVSLIALCYIDKKRFAGPIEKAKNYLVNSQFCEGHYNVKPENWHYGGWDYKPKEGISSDMSNVQFAMEALHEAGLDKNSPVWKRAQKFLERCQNRTESNKMKGFVVLNDGGFMYFPGNSKAGTVKVKGGVAHPSYGTMTYAGLKSFIYSHVDKKDERVQGAYKWISKHYTLEENYGLGTRKNPKGGQQGLFYYYVTFAKALDAWGEKYLLSGDGERYNWARELADKLVKIQHREGFWVNKNPRWWEGDPTLVTSYTLNALNVCLKNLKKKK